MDLRQGKQMLLNVWFNFVKLLKFFLFPFKKIQSSGQNL